MNETLLLKLADQKSNIPEFKNTLETIRRSL
jgi:hypothetical protein